jgi:1-acyl-sn-glycerol-3-phosphate acyltransferase
MRIISWIYIKMIGWKIRGKLPDGLEKFVIVAAPHTSMYDFVNGRAGLYVLRVKGVHTLIKKELFKFPLNLLLKLVGAIPVDRSSSNNTVREAANLFKTRKHLALLMAPEATRKLVHRWKRGFYHIAVAANVPIVLTYVDYAKKEGGIGPVIHPSGDFEADFKQIEDFYSTVSARFPKQFNLSPENRKAK